MAKIPDMPSWKSDPITHKQLGMINWLLNCRGIIRNSRLGTMSPADLTKGQASEIIDKLLSRADDDEIVELLKSDDIIVTGRAKRERSWQELVAEDVFERWA